MPVAMMAKASAAERVHAEDMPDVLKGGGGGKSRGGYDVAEEMGKRRASARRKQARDGRLIRLADVNRGAIADG